MLSEKAVTEFMDLYEKKFGKRLSREEAYSQASRLVNLVRLLYDCEMTERHWQAKLVDYPKGYHLEDGKTYNCLICHANIQGQATWYDKNGIKCLLCQKALNMKIIPALVCRDRESWYSLHDFEYYFNIKAPSIKRLVRENKLKARVVQGESNKPYFYLFLIKDNTAILPPKPESYMVTDDKGYSHLEYKKVNISNLLKLL